MAKKEATRAVKTPNVDEPIPKTAYNPEDEIGSGIMIDGKKMKATPPPAPASAASSPAKSKANGGKLSSYAKGGVTRADGCVRKGHTKGRMV